MIRGIIFDLDGTLMDSGLDFDLMRQEMELPPGPILEAIERLPAAQAAHCRSVLHRHEVAGAQRATPIPGVVDFLRQVQSRGLKQAIVTRNSREIAQAMLRQLPTPFDPVLTRDDGPVKPDPWSIQTICDGWQASPAEVIMIGDHWFDVACAHRAGARGVLYIGGPCGNRDLQECNEHHRPDFVLKSFVDPEAFWQWIGSGVVSS